LVSETSGGQLVDLPDVRYGSSQRILGMSALPPKADIAAGASGAPGGEKDEACVKAGIDKVADQLK
jgi:hypothetical protein